MKKGFTLLELLVVVCILFIFSGIIFGVVTAYNGIDNVEGDNNENVVDYMNPEYSRAMSERRQAEALEEQNRLKREELDLRKKELEKE